MDAYEITVSAIITHIESQQWEEAEQALLSMKAQVLPEERQIWVLDNLGFVQYRLGKIAAALSCCDGSLAINPENAYAHKGKGICLAAQGRVQEGITSILRAIQHNPSFFDAYHDLAVILLDQGEALQAKQWAQRAYQLNPVEGASLLRRILAQEGTPAPTP